MKGFLADPVLLILLFSAFVFSGILLFVAVRHPTDGQTFQVFSGLATGFAGGVLARVKPQEKRDTDPHVAVHETTVTTAVHSIEAPQAKT